MTSPAETVRSSNIPARLVAAWNGVAARWNPVLIIVVAWALLTVPLVFFRGFNSDEGVAVSIARTALENGYWLDVHMFNQRFVERPTLLSWIIAGISLPFGGVSQFTARLPIILFLLGGCLLIFSLLRRVGAGAPAALAGTALFLACPLVLRSYVMATADMPLAVLLFLAFYLWWDAYSGGTLSIRRWSAVGGVLALAALLKGPQPISYFAFGVGAFILWTRSWRQIPGFVLAGIICVIPLAAWYGCVYEPDDLKHWISFMRINPGVPLANPLKALWELFTEMLPAALGAGAFFISLGFRGSSRVQTAFVKAIACYAFITALVILFWPGGSTPRYYFPIVLPLCVFGGLAYDELSERRPQIVMAGLSVTLGILAYAFLYSVVASPLMPRQFRSAKLDAVRITELVRAAPAPIYRSGAVGLNVFPYVPGPIFGVRLRALDSISGPAWIAVTPEEAQTLMQKRPGALRAVTSFGHDNEWRLLRLEK